VETNVAVGVGVTIAVGMGVRAAAMMLENTSPITGPNRTKIVITTMMRMGITIRGSIATQPRLVDMLWTLAIAPLTSLSTAFHYRTLFDLRG
jgi:hypothetical protein